MQILKTGNLRSRSLRNVVDIRARMGVGRGGGIGDSVCTSGTFPSMNSGFSMVSG